MSEINWIEVILRYLLFLPIITVHEWAHAFAAHKCGDDTARLMGRMTLDPIPHMDPVGTVALPLIGLATGGGVFGWGRPVPVNPARMRRPSRDDVIVSLAGPASNFALALLALAVMRIAFVVPGPAGIAPAFVRYGYEFAFFSVFLGLFNLIPVPPLDGSHLLRHVVKMDPALYARFGSYGFLIIIVLFVFFDLWRPVAALAQMILLGMRTILFF